MNEVMPTAREEFNAVIQFCKGLGVDIGCGTNRLDPSVLTIDVYPHKDADMVMNSKVLPFRDNVFDFVFSSHCLEDFEPSEIKAVLTEWLRCVKIGGRLVLLLPDMEGGRYPKVEDGGNPSHKVNVGVNYMKNIIKDLPVEVEQVDTIDHSRFFTFDIVLKKTGGIKHGKA